LVKLARRSENLPPQRRPEALLRVATEKSGRDDVAQETGPDQTTPSFFK
jgi:hypothetical protein